MSRLGHDLFTFVNKSFPSWELQPLLQWTLKKGEGLETRLQISNVWATPSFNIGSKRTSSLPWQRNSFCGLFWQPATCTVPCRFADNLCFLLPLQQSQKGTASLIFWHALIHHGENFFLELVQKKSVLGELIIPTYLPGNTILYNGEPGNEATPIQLSGSVAVG